MRASAALRAASAWWSLSYGLYWSVTGLDAKLALAEATQTGAILVPLAWTIFTLRYTHRERLLNPLWVGLLAAIPAVVRTILALAATLGVDVVTEGVETGQQLEELRNLECRYGQGYLFHRPLEADAVHALLVAQSSAMLAESEGDSGDHLSRFAPPLST